ncbi:MAG: inositol monophosphatase family protein [Thioalkalivibrio sp.]
MQPMLNIAVKAARAAGQVIVRHVGRLDTLTVQNKSPNDFVSEVDHMAEREIIRVIQRAYPDHAILAEESGAQGRSEYEWIVDPLDGTTNFLHDIPQFAVSIALRYQDRLEQAVVYDPVKEELFSASRGGGATLNSRRIRVTTLKDLNGALLGTGIPFREDQDLDSYLKGMRALLPGTAGVRRAGSAALDLAYVAAGRLDGFWEYGLKPWDMAAGVLLVQEAGGLVGDPRGGLDAMSSGDVVAAGPKVFKSMLQRLSQAR